MTLNTANPNRTYSANVFIMGYVTFSLGCQTTWLRQCKRRKIHEVMRFSEFS